MNLDLYHAQIGEGNLLQLVERALPPVGEIQVADVPGRREPGTGELNYPAVAAALDRLGYSDPGHRHPLRPQHAPGQRPAGRPAAGQRRPADP
jgi:hypothetical protein